MLTLAQGGVYSQMQLKDWISGDKKTNTLQSLREDKYQISDDIKRMVRFEKFNLMNAFKTHSTKHHIIFCRNVMIYFKNETIAGAGVKVLREPGAGGYSSSD